MIQAARKYGRVFVALNSDEWLFRKKGYFFMPWHERAELLRGYGCVVIAVDDADGTVCEALRTIRPAYFVNGGDRSAPNQAEDSVCRSHGIEQVFEVGGGKIQSSSSLIARLWQRLNA